ncbi:MAG: ABC transporter permease [Acidobacteria bacterium]|nr:ABC transporter permease [Acidobacteriota bacterium]
MPGGVRERATGALITVGEVSLFAGKAAREALTPPFEFRETIRQIYELGAKSAPLIAVSGVAVGVVLSMHTRASLERFGAESMIPAGLAIALVRETGPLTAGLLLSGRIGAGIGAELGAMRVTEQIDALEASAVDAFRYLVVTRVVACVIALPLLTTLMNFSGMFGGFIAENAVTGLSLSVYFQRAFALIEMTDYVPATIKTMVFGFIIATISSFLGFTTSSGTEGVGRASTRSVVLSSILIIVANVVLVRLIFFVFPEAAGG